MAGAIRPAVLFDLDGTLIDTAPDFHRILNALRAEEGLPAQPYGRTRAVVSDGASALIQDSFAIGPEDARLEPLRQRLLARYQRELAVESRLFDGLAPLLNWLEAAAIPWGVVTNKPERYSAPLLAQLQLQPRCAVLVCPDHVRHRKPHPQALLLACERVRCRPDHSLYVGDHRRDIEAGRNAGMSTLAAGYGYLHPGDPADSWGADGLVESPAQMLDWIQVWLPRSPDH